MVGSTGLPISPRRKHPGDVQFCEKLWQSDVVLKLQDDAEGLMARIYRMRQILDSPDIGSQQFSEAFWKAGVFPDIPRLCIQLAKKFPEPVSKSQLEKVDRVALEQLRDKAELYLSAMEPWMMIIVDLMKFHEQALKVILELSSTIITLLPSQNPLILHSMMNLFCSFVRVNLLSGKIPRKMLLQTYNLTHTMIKGGQDYELYQCLVQFIELYDPPLKGLQEDLNFISPRIGEILESITSTVLRGLDYEKLRTEGFLSPFHPRYPDKLTNSAHPARAQDLANVTRYLEWVVFGYLVCPSELLRGNAADLAMVILKETLVLPLFRDECILLHDEYQVHVLPKIDETKKIAKVNRLKQKDADQDYNFAKRIRKVICDAQDVAAKQAENIHRDRRLFLRQELCRMVVFFSDQPSLIAPNIQMLFSALSMASAEVVWYFTLVGVFSGKLKVGRVVAVEIDATDTSIGFLLDGIDKLCGLVLKYVSAIKAYALSFLAGVAERMKFLITTPGMMALDIEAPLLELLHSVSDCIDNLPKIHNEKALSENITLCEFRKNWLSLMMLLSSSKSPVNLKHLEKATVSAGKESFTSDGNTAYLWSRSVDDIEGQLMQHANLKVLYFYRQHLMTVFKHTMFGHEGQPQHCCAWLAVANSFPNNAHAAIPNERARISQDAIAYVESVLDSIMGGLEGLINILDSEGGFGSLEYKLSPDQAAIRVNQASKSGNPSGKALKHNLDYPLPGSESEPSNRDSIKMLEAAFQRLTSLCTALNELDAICVLDHAFVPQEYVRERVVNNFRKHLLSIVNPEVEPFRVSACESLIARHMSIMHLIEKHIRIDLTQGFREVILKEAFSCPIRNLQDFEYDEDGGTAVSSVCKWYMANIVKDVNGVGVVYNPLDKTFRCVRPWGGMANEVLADLSEMKAFVRVFGPYGVEKLDRLLHEYLEALIGCIDIALRSSREALEALALNMHNKSERDKALRHVQEIESLMAFSIQIGHALSFRSLLAEASGKVLQSNIPVLFSLLADYAKYAPSSLPEHEEILNIKLLAGRLGAISDHDAMCLYSVLSKVGGVGDALWILLPYLYVCCMNSHLWNSSAYNIQTGGFNNNVHCLARCINAIMIASELARSERREVQRQVSQEDSSEGGKLESEALTLEGFNTVEASIKSMMRTFVQCSAAIVLDSWSECNRSPMVAKLIFLDHLCMMSPYLSRSTLETHIPYTILRSIYQLHYENAVPTLMLVSPSRRHMASAGGSHVPLKSTSFLVESGGDASGGFSGFRGASSVKHRRPHEISGGRGVRLSGPLDYGNFPKVSVAEGVAAPLSPLERFSSSQSGPVIYKASA